MKWILYHIPKTGGQTIINSFQKHFIPNVELIHLGVDGDNEIREKGLLPWKKRPKIERDNAKLIIGHYVSVQTQNLFLELEMAKHMIIFREPALHIISLYNFKFRHTKNPPSFKSWYRKLKLKGCKNWQATNFYRHFLKKGYLKSYFLNDFKYFGSILDDFFYVGVTENLNRDLPVLADRMGIVDFTTKTKNVSGVKTKSHFVATISEIEFLNKDNPLDYKLWSYACKRSDDFYLGEFSTS
jgi:hypothetical protein